MAYMRSGSMTGNRYQTEASRTIDKSKSRLEWEMHSLHGMSSEVGEIHGLYQKAYQGHDIDEDHLKKETGDLLWFIAEYCTAMGWQLEDVMHLNIEKLKKRYPDGFEKNRSVVRREGDV